MKKVAASLLATPLVVVALVGAVASPGVVFELEIKTGSEPAQTGTASVEGQALKMSLPSSASAPSNDMIFRGDRREMVMVDHARKSYFVIDEATLKQMIGQMSNAMAQMEEMLKNVPESQRGMVEQMMKARGMGPAPAARPEPVLRRTAETATHSGFPTVKYEVLLDGRKTRELWVTDWDNVQGFQEARPAFEAMASFMEDMMAAIASSPMGSAANMNSNGYEFMTELGGFPVLTREFGDNGELEGETLLKSASQRTLSPADFEPPTGYTRQQMPGQ